MAGDMNDLRKQQQEKQKALTCDPFTLVHVTRERINSVARGESNIQDQLPWLEEILARFDQQARATIGSAQFAGYRSPTG